MYRVRIEDPQRPEFHFLPPKNWMNDPNGLIQWQGIYHMFYQYNPQAAVWGDIHWGHATSRDLVHWTDLPIALAPSPDSPDQEGCWSGCMVNEAGVPTILYTGIQNGEQRPCLATSHDGLLTWQKYTGNPVIRDPPAGLEVVGFRDHAVWREADGWRQLIGSGITGVGGTVFLYRSPDLIDWEYLGPMLVGDEHQVEGLNLGAMWECPAFFPLGDRHVLVLSVWEHNQTMCTAALTGSYRGDRFIHNTTRKLDFGNRYYYAPQSMQDEQGRQLIWGWIQEGRSQAAQVAAGWSGVMSLPRILTSTAGGLVHQEFAPELQSLRRGQMQIGETGLSAGDSLAAAPGDQLEIRAGFQAHDQGRAGLKLRRSPDGAEETLLWIDWERQELVVDLAAASLDPEADKTILRGDIQPSETGAVNLHAYLDHSVLEVIANGVTAITARVYPTRPDSLGVEVFASQGKVNLKRMEVYQLASIWSPE